MKTIPLTRGQHAIVDDEDFDWLNQWKWYISNKGYARRDAHVAMRDGKQIRQAVFMHRLINQTPDGLETDHINRNQLDNRRLNLRSCTRSENGQNANVRRDSRTGLKGVTWHPSKSKFQAYVTAGGRKKSLGYFETAIEASRKREAVCG